MKNRFILIGVIIAGIILRIIYWIYTVPYPSFDISCLGLTVRLIAKGELLPVFIYGTESAGSVFAYISALFAIFFGVSTFILFITELIFTILFILAVYFTGKELFGRKGGIISASIVSLAPSILVKSSVFPSGVYSIILFLGTICFLISLRIQKYNRLSLYSLLGFSLGISLWISFYSICFIIVSIIFFLQARKPFLDLKRFYALIFSFLFGSSLFWMFNLRHNFCTFNCIIPKSIELVMQYGVKDALSLYLLNIFKTSFILAGIYFAFFVYFCYSIRGKLFKAKSALILLYIITAVVILARIKVKPEPDLPPFIILFAGFPYIISGVLLKIKSKVILYSLIIAVVLLQLSECFSVMIIEKTGNDSENMDLGWLISGLKKNNLHSIYSTEDLSAVLNFIAKEDIIAVPYEGYSYPRYTSIVDSSSNISVLLPRNKSPVLQNNLDYICRSYKRMFFGSYAVFYSLEGMLRKRAEVLPYKWSACASFNNEDAQFAFDRDVKTRWTTNVRQLPDMFYVLDLGEIVLIDKIIIYLGNNNIDRARGLDIEVSTDGEKWRRIVHLKNNYNILFWSGPHLFWKNDSDRQEYYFNPVRAHYIRFRQTNFIEVFFNYWSINEIFVYSPSGGLQKDFNSDIKDLGKFINEKGFKKLYADCWICENFKDIAVRKGVVDLSIESAIITDRYSRIDNQLKEYNINYSKDNIGDFSVYYSLSSKYSGLPCVDKWELTGSSNIQPNGCEKAFDDNPWTRWSTEKCQSEGFYFQAQLEKEKELCGVRLWHKGSPNDWPRGLKIEVLDKNSEWKEAGCKKDFSNSLYWNGFGILNDSSKYLTFVFGPVTTKGVRCVLGGNSPFYYWSIHEIELLTSTGTDMI